MNLHSWFTKLKNAVIPFKKQNTEQTIRIEGIEDEDSPWWGAYQIAEEQSHYSKIGHLIICIDRFNQGWHLASYREDDTEKLQKKTKTLEACLNQDTITLKPTLPDRTMIFNLDYPLFVPPRSELLLYTSTPVLVRIDIGSPPLLWEEIPTDILPDTWRGKNTQTGELCYAANTSASLRLENMQQDILHATTPVFISNRANDGFFLKEIHVPLPFLSVYCDSTQQLWTEQVKLLFEETEQPDTLIMQDPLKELKDTILISAARVPIKARFKKLFSTLRGN